MVSTDNQTQIIDPVEPGTGRSILKFKVGTSLVSPPPPKKVSERVGFRTKFRVPGGFRGR